MSHSVSETAARAVKNSQRKIEETRTPEQIIKDLRLNVKSRLYVAPLDIELVLAKMDMALAENNQLTFMVEAADKALITTRADRDRFAHETVDLKAQVATLVTLQEALARLNAQIAEFRDVYEQENRSMAVKMERVPDYGTGPDGIGTPDMP